ncbi:hypothetical protein [Halonatronum saccharophilum]|uniref:hypothetical protein n=1 Tax=Halonatronum saccharophilum TaxID=150060 RepID=UPI000482347F|nr:hypothetical protein [Halonatronum saccharophilum]
MELVYIWVDKYRDEFIRQGFNFSNDIFYEFDYDNNELKETDKKTIENLYNLDGLLEEDKSKISSITGIIGKNGAGKSLLLRMIVEAFFEPKKSLYDRVGAEVGINGFVIVRDNNEDLDAYILGYDDTFIDSEEEGNAKPDEIDKIKKALKEIIAEERIKVLSKKDENLVLSLKEMNLVYYSNIFDYSTPSIN